jgi:hypothetical protein
VHSCAASLFVAGNGSHSAKLGLVNLRNFERLGNLECKHPCRFSSALRLVCPKAFLRTWSQTTLREAVHIATHGYAGGRNLCGTPISIRTIYAHTKICDLLTATKHMHNKREPWLLLFSSALREAERTLQNACSYPHKAQPQADSLATPSTQKPNKKYARCSCCC